MTEKQTYITQNGAYRAAQPLKPAGIVLHSTGCCQVDPYVYQKRWNRSTASVCVHTAIGMKNGELTVLQLLPETIRCWGCGAGYRGTGNRTLLQIELCEDNLKDGKYLRTLLEAAAELCARWAVKYNLKTADIRSHKEWHAAGYASNHADCDHWLGRFGLTMEDFRALVEQKKKTAAKTTPKKETAKKAPSSRTVTVKKGNTLWGLARTYLGKGSRFTEIMALNELQAPAIYVGQVLYLPEK